MPWEKSYCEREVLDRAAWAFWEKGYAATSMAELVKATGINRGSIYAAFTDKRTLFLRALDHYSEVYCAAFLNGLAAENGPKDAILAAFDVAGDADADCPGGCLIVNTALELSPHDSEIAAYVDARLRKVEDFFCGRVEAAIGVGAVAPQVDARATAQSLLGLFIGLRVLTRSDARPEAVSAIQDQAKTLLH